MAQHSAQDTVLSAPEFSMPEIQQALVREAYQNASVILEYGSGGSTALAASLPDKFIISVENDPRWAANMVSYFQQSKPPSMPIVHVVNIGEVGRWGRPRTAEKYRDFPDYPLNVWDQEFFRQPDVVLIDGRARIGCLMATMLRTRKNVTVLFDDYKSRTAYHEIERIVEPDRIVGEMAVFNLTPRQLDPEHLTLVARSFVSVDVKYRIKKSRWKRALRILLSGSDD